MTIQDCICQIESIDDDTVIFNITLSCGCEDLYLNNSASIYTITYKLGDPGFLMNIPKFQISN